MPQPGWSSYLVTLDTPVDGEHDLWLVAGPPSAVAAAGAADASGQTAYGVIGSIAWLRTVRRPSLTRADPPGHVSGRIST